MKQEVLQFVARNALTLLLFKLGIRSAEQTYYFLDKHATRIPADTATPRPIARDK